MVGYIFMPALTSCAGWVSYSIERVEGIINLQVGADYIKGGGVFEIDN